MNRKKIVLLSPFPIFPPNNGGAIRIFNLAQMLSKKYRIVVYSQCVNMKMILDLLQGKPLLNEIKINKNLKIIQSYNILYNSILFLTSRIGAQNFLASKALRLLRPKKLENEFLDAVLIQVEHPWQVQWAKNISTKFKIPLVLSCHNVEHHILTNSISNIPFIKNILINHLKKIELEACKMADYVIFLSKNDRQYFQKNSCINRSHILPVSIRNISIKQRNKRIVYKPPYTILFVGSNWKQNTEALHYIESLALQNENNKTLKFLVVGSVGESKRNKINLTYTGRVNSTSKYYKKADVFINPTTTGSGVNIKILEAMSYSLPIISTPFGVRGIKVTNNRNGIISPVKNFNQNILNLLKNSILRKKISKNARKTIQQYYCANNNSKDIHSYYKKIIH